MTVYKYAAGAIRLMARLFSDFAVIGLDLSARREGIQSVCEWLGSVTAR